MESFMTADPRGRAPAAQPLSPQEFDVIYDQHKAAIFRFICHLTPDLTEAEDLFQDLWLRVVRNLPEQPNRQNLKPWLITIVLNLHRDSLRKKRVRRLFLLGGSKYDLPETDVTGEPSAVNPSLSDPAFRAEQAVLQRKISRAVSRLPERQRRIFILKEVEGYRQAEIAAILGIPVGTVKSLLHRAVKRLQGDLAAHNPGRERVKCDVKILSV
jgi:RNA polymerase sigma-70 factor (ECF subfamily)